MQPLELHRPQRLLVPVLSLFASLTTLDAQVAPVFIVCDGVPPPVEYAYCTCEEIEPGVWDWVCFDNDEGGNPGGPGTSTDEFKELQTFSIPFPDPFGGLNAITNVLRAGASGGPAPQLLRARDGNGNGVLESSEKILFSDASTLFSGRLLGLALDQIDPRNDPEADQVSIYYSVEGGGLVRAVDLDGDGEATAVGSETRVALGMSSLRNFSGGSGQMSVVDFVHIEAARRTSGPARVMAFEKNDECVYLLSDTAPFNGLFDGVGERHNLFYGAGVPGTCGSAFCSVDTRFQLNADVAAGALPSCYDTATGKAELGALEFVETGMGPRYFLASTLEFTGTSTSRHGLIYRGRDQNTNSTLNDAGEVMMYFDPAIVPGVIGQILDIEWYGNSLFVLQLPPSGGNAEIWRLREIDGIPGAMSPGEYTFVQQWRKASPVPTDLVIRPRTEGPPTEFAIPYGSACAGLAGTPQIGFQGQPTLGMPFRIQVGGGTPGSLCVLGMGLSREQGVFGGLLLPLPLEVIPGCLVLQSADLGFPNVLDPQGAASAGFNPLPANPALIGAQAYFQWFLLEPGGAPTPFSLTQGLYVRLDV